MRGRISALNALRGLAAFMVAIDHTILLTTKVHEGPLFYFATFMGSFAVGAFFLLSGFVIMMSLERVSVGEFLVQRIFRIYPVIVFAVFARMISQIYFDVRPFDLNTIKIFLLNISLFGNLKLPIESNIEPIIWTLTIEVKFYIISALIYAILKDRVSSSVQKVYYCLAFVFVLLGALFPPISNPARVDLALAVSTLPFLFIGSLTYFYYSKNINLRSYFLLMAAMLFSFSYAPFTYFLFFEKGFSSWILAYVIFIFAIFSGRLEKNASNYWWALLGAISYPLYAIHSAVVEFLILSHPKSDPNALIIRALILIPVIAYLIHRFVEAPVHAWSKRITIFKG